MLFFLQKRRKTDNEDSSDAKTENKPSSEKDKSDSDESKSSTAQTKPTTTHLRITKDMNALDLPKTCSIELGPDNDITNFKLVICPDEGFYQNGRFVFSFKVGPNYPIDPPKVKCETNTYHPNIDLNGSVCLSILREDWKPILTLNSIIYGLQHLLLEPNADDPLNKEAADVLKNNPHLFKKNVLQAIRGGYVGSVKYKCHSKNLLQTYRLEQIKKSYTPRKPGLLSAQKRVTKDWYDLILPSYCKVDYGTQLDLMNFLILISPDEGFYEFGTYSFRFQISEGYPLEPPAVNCDTVIFHPNISVDGNICLDIIERGWKVEYSLSSVIYSLILLLLEPGFHHSVNKDAEEVFTKQGRAVFSKTVMRTIFGDNVNSQYYPPCLNEEKYKKFIEELEENELI